MFSIRLLWFLMSRWYVCRLMSFLNVLLCCLENCHHCFGASRLLTWFFLFVAFSSPYGCIRDSRLESFNRIDDFYILDYKYVYTIFAFSLCRKCSHGTYKRKGKIRHIMMFSWMWVCLWTHFLFVHLVNCSKRCHNQNIKIVSSKDGDIFLSHAEMTKIIIYIHTILKKNSFFLSAANVRIAKKQKKDSLCVFVANAKR